MQAYVTSYALDGNQGRQTALMFFTFAVIGNLINVVMEEGVFRGLFLRLAETKFSFLKALLLSSALFGLWHVAAPVRSYQDGEMSAVSMISSALMLIRSMKVHRIRRDALIDVRACPPDAAR